MTESERQFEEPEDEIVLQPQQQQYAQRWMGCFDLHPERRPLHLNQDDEDLHELNNPRAPLENKGSSLRAGVTSPRRASIRNDHSPTRFAQNCRGARFAPAASVGDNNTPQPPMIQATITQSAPTPTQTPTYSPRDLQRKKEERGRLSGKPDAKAGGALIEMLPIAGVSKRRAGPSAAAGAGGGSPGKNQFITAQAQTQVAKESSG